MKYLLAALVLSLTPHAASAADAASPGESWTSHDMVVQHLKNGARNEVRNVTKPVKSIYSGNKMTPGNVVFSCVGGSLTVSFAPKPVDFAALLTKDKAPTGTAQRRRLDYRINGEKQPFVDWVKIPKLGVYRARKTSTAAKLYNAALRGQEVDVKIRGKDYMPLQLPTVDTAFKNFGSECGLGL